MSYDVKLSLRQIGNEGPLTAEELARRLVPALWPLGEHADTFSGSFDKVLSVPTGGAFEDKVCEVLIHRELGDDYHCVLNSVHADKALCEALAAQFMRELNLDGYRERLRTHGLDLVACAVHTDTMAPEEVAALSEAEARWFQEVQSEVAQLRENEERDADLLGYARTLARNGSQAPRNLGPSAMDAYEKTAKAGIRTRIERIALMLNDETKHNLLLSLLDDAATYLRNTTTP